MLKYLGSTERSLVGGRKFRVWRRLVARLNGVQEAAGSIPVTRTKRKPCRLNAYKVFCFLFILLFLVNFMYVSILCPFFLLLHPKQLPKP